MQHNGELRFAKEPDTYSSSRSVAEFHRADALKNVAACPPREMTCADQRTQASVISGGECTADGPLTPPRWPVCRSQQQKACLLMARQTEMVRRPRSCCSPLIYALILSLFQDALGLELSEHVIPSHLLLGESADLVCRYTLHNETLYSVKWYKDNEQFYNFIASPKIAKRMYPLPGIRVDMPHSTSERVRLLDVGFNTAGKYGCEVSVDAPSFHTVIAIGHMLVIAVPKSEPEIEGGQDFYRLGDRLEVNCTAHRSKPAALLNWHVNGKQAAYNSLVQYPVQTSPEDGLETRQLGLRLTLQPHHFNGGVLSLRCTASLTTLYSQHTDLKVALPPKPDQSPAKTLEIKEHSRGIRHSAHPVIFLLAAVIFFLLRRPELR